jgi:hypothetical protein
MLDRIGYYCWAGPGTIRMIKVKYFNPRIDEKSLLSSYEYDYLARVRDLFGITDFWATYSWGFSDKTEQEDRQFLIERVENFKRLGIRLHAYIQGPNLVYDEFPDKAEWWARDERSRLITYYKGRWMCSIHNPDYVNYVVKKIEDTHGLGFDGIFVDNIQHGQLGVPAPAGQLPFVFCGDYSAAAQAAFRAETGHTIPDDFERDPALTLAYLEFRMRANTQYIATLADAAHRGGMVFGSNFYDPKFDPKYIYAIDMAAKPNLQDYVLFENHALPRADGKVSNLYVERIIDRYQYQKPVFVVSYRNGVGMAPQFSQEDIDNLFSEAATSNFRVSLKGSEFTTNGVWHNLDVSQYRKPRLDVQLERRENNRPVDLVPVLLRFPLFRWYLKKYFNPTTRAAFEWSSLRFLVNVVYNTTIK